MTASGTVPVAIGGSDDLIDRARRLADRVDGTVQQVVRTAERVARLLPPALADHVNELCARLTTMARECREILENLLRAAGSPWKLWQAGEDWVSEFSNPVSASASEMDSIHLDAPLRRWDGTAGPAYQATIERQRRAVTALAAIGSDLNASLQKAAVAICALWAMIAGLLLTVLGELLLAAVAVSSGAGAPVGAGKAVAAISALILGTAGAVTAFVAVIDAVSDSTAAIRQRLNDRSDLDAWPETGGERFDHRVDWEGPS